MGDAVDFLSTVNQIEVLDEDIKAHPATTNEVVQCCVDIKVLGKKELKMLLAWRKKVRKDMSKDKSTATTTTEDDVEELEATEEDKQEELDHVTSDLKAEEEKEVKKKKKRVREVKKKMRERLASKMEASTEEAGINEQDLFALNLMKNKKDIDAVDEMEPDNTCEDDVSDQDDKEEESDDESES